MNIINPNGEITLLNEEHQPTTIANIKQGLTFDSCNAHMQSVRLTIMTGNNELSDLFIFCDNGKMPLVHLQSRYINPTLFALYMKLLTKEKTCQVFIAEIIADYFVSNLGYTVPEDLTSLCNLNPK